MVSYHGHDCGIDEFAGCGWVNVEFSGDKVEWASYLVQQVLLHVISIEVEVDPDSEVSVAFISSEV